MPDTETAGAAKSLPAARVTGFLPAVSQEELSAKTALFNQSRDSLALRGLPLPFLAPLESGILWEKPLRAVLTPVLSPWP